MRTPLKGIIHGIIEISIAVLGLTILMTNLNIHVFTFIYNQECFHDFGQMIFCYKTNIYVCITMNTTVVYLCRLSPPPVV